MAPYDDCDGDRRGGLLGSGYAFLARGEPCRQCPFTEVGLLGGPGGIDGVRGGGGKCRARGGGKGGTLGVRGGGGGRLGVRVERGGGGAAGGGAREGENPLETGGGGGKDGGGGRVGEVYCAPVPFPYADGAPYGVET